MQTKTVLVLVVILTVFCSGCASLSSTLADKGNGTSKTYQVPVDKLWAEMPTVINHVGLEYVRSDLKERYILAERKASVNTWGEYVAIFFTPEGQRTTVEIVAKPVLYTNVASAYWTWPDTIFKEMDIWWSDGPDYEKAVSRRMAQMERKIDTNNPIEANLMPGNGLIYIFREPYVLSSHLKAKIQANGQAIVDMPNTYYFLYSVLSGEVKFTTGSLTNRDNQSGEIKEVPSLRTGKETIKVKPGYVYYLKLAVIPENGCSLEHVPYEEGAKLIENYELKQIKE